MKCEDAKHTCDKKQYHEATLWEKVKLTFHLIYCRACRKYSANNNKLTQILKKSDIKSLEKDEKSDLKKLLQEEMSK